MDYDNIAHDEADRAAAARLAGATQWFPVGMGSNVMNLPPPPRQAVPLGGEKNISETCKHPMPSGKLASLRVDWPYNRPARGSHR